MLVLRDALKYKALEAKVGKVKKKAKAAPTAKPGAKPATSEKATSRKRFVQAKGQLAQTGSRADGARALEALGDD
jgi:hypothetical protein